MRFTFLLVIHVVPLGIFHIVHGERPTQAGTDLKGKKVTELASNYEVASGGHFHASKNSTHPTKLSLHQSRGQEVEKPLEKKDPSAGKSLDDLWSLNGPLRIKNGQGLKIFDRSKGCVAIFTYRGTIPARQGKIYF